MGRAEGGSSLSSHAPQPYFRHHGPADSLENVYGPMLCAEELTRCALVWKQGSQ